jgi:hypothetical protein
VPVQVVPATKTPVVSCKDRGIAGVSHARLATEAGQHCNAGYLYGVRHILLAQNTMIFWLRGAVCESNLLPYISLLLMGFFVQLPLKHHRGIGNLGR